VKGSSSLGFRDKIADARTENRFGTRLAEGSLNQSVTDFLQELPFTAAQVYERAPRGGAGLPKAHN
jgi:hypothetical protein